MKKISVIQFPNKSQAQVPVKMKATVALAMHVDMIGYTGILIIDNTKIEITYNQKELAPGYIPKVGDKVIFDSGNRDDLEFPYMQVKNIRRRVGV